MTFKEAFQKFTKLLDPIYSNGEAESIARIIFEDLFNVFSNDFESIISIQQSETLNKIASRLLNNEPIQYILGQADFYGLKFKVNPYVLIPRSETEELIYWILNEFKKEETNSSFQLLDIGTGSGCIPITIKKKRPTWKVLGSDISKKAIGVANENALLNKVQIDFLNFDILDKSQWNFKTKFDLIVSNPPYIPEKEKAIMPQNVLENEPHLALFVKDEDPLIFYETIADFALQNLKKGGHLFFEMNEFNALEVKQLLISKGFKNSEIQKDIYGKNRMIRANL